MRKKWRTLFLLDNSFVFDKRVYLEAKSLVKQGHQVILVAVKQAGLPTQETRDGIEIHRLLDRSFNDLKKPRWFPTNAKMLSDKFSFDTVHAHDQAMFYLGVQIKKRKPKVKLIYDSHELFHEWPVNLHDGKDLWLKAKTIVVRKLEILREKRNGKHIDRLITVNDSLADNLTSYFLLKQPALSLKNLPERVASVDKTQILREKFSIPEDHKIIVYFGKNVYLRSLNIEQVFHEFKDVSNVSFVFICSLNAVAREVMEYIKAKGYKHIYFHDLISPEDIQRYLGSADVGLLSTWNKKDKSYWLALGNKLFDYIRAGIPVLTTQQPEYKRIIDDFACGIAVNPDISGAYLEGFRMIENDIDTFAEKSRQAADVLCWENEEHKLIELYESL